MTDEVEVTEQVSLEMEQMAIQKARIRAKAAMWDFDVAVFLFAVLALLIILLFEGIGTEIVAPVAMFGLAMGWLMGRRRGRQLYQSFHNEELFKLTRELLEEKEKKLEGMTNELTERKQAEELFRSLCDSSPIGIYITQDGKFQYVNPQFERYIGANADEILGTDSMSYILPADKDVVRANAIAMLKGKQFAPYEFRVVNKAGDISYIMETVNSISYEGKRAVLGNYMDITERKQVQEALKRSEEFLKTIFNSTSDAISIIDVHDFTIVEANDAFLQRHGLKEGEVIGKTCYQITHHRSDPCAPPDDICPLRDTVTTGEHSTAEHVHYTKDSEKIYVEVSTSPIKDEGGNIIQVVHVSRDITERKKVEEELHIAEKNFRNSLDSSPLGIRIVNAEGEVLYANQAILDIYGYSSVEELKAVPTKQRYTPESYAEHRERIQRRKLGKPVPADYEISIVRKDGEIRHQAVSRREVIWDGETQFQTIYQDITERKQAEEELVKLRKAVEASGEAIFLTDRDGVITFVNPEFTRLYGYSAAEVIGKTTPRILKSGRMKTQDYEGFWQTLLNKQVMKGALVNKTKDGRLITIEGSANPVLDEQGNIIGFLAIQRDITERKKMEKQLIVTDRLASIGELASGIAHELNNPLTSVIGFSDLLLGKEDLPDDVKEDVKIISREAQRTAGIVRNLLTFARKRTPKKQSVDINKAIETVLELRDYEQKVSNIEVDTQFAPDLPEIMADGFQLQQVFLNIIINAEHFMIEAHRRGALTITTERLGDIIRASFADDGPGIAKENLGHLFDPFFTTKGVGKGTGLGLSISYGIITEHGGKIYAESRLGKGATFVVELPISQ